MASDGDGGGWDFSPDLACRGGSHVSYVKPLDHPMFLQTLSERKPIFPDGRLENIKATIQNDLPSGIGDNIPGMCGARGVEGPGEINP